MRPLGRRLVGFGFGLCFGLAQNRSRSRRGGKVGILRFLRDFQGSVGAGGNLLLVFAGFHAPAFSTALFGCRADQLFSGGAITSYDVRAEADRDGSVQVLVDHYRAPRQAIAKSGLVDLPPAVSDGHGVVLFHHALRLYREDPVQVAPTGAPERRAFLRSHHLELAVELPDVPLPQKGVGAFHGTDPRQSEFLRQPPLPGSKTPLRPPARLRRIRRNHLHSQRLHGPSNLRQAVIIHLFALLHGDEEMAPPVAVQGAEQTLVFDHLAQAGHHRPRRFFLHQLRVVDLAGGVVQNYDQVIPAIVVQPAVLAAVDVQQHAGQRPPRPPAPVRAPLVPFGHQPSPLQRFLYPRIAQPDRVLVPQLFVEVPDVQVVVRLFIEAQHLLYSVQRNPFSTRFPLAAVSQSAVAALFEPFAPAAHRPIRDPDYLGRRPPGDLLRHGLQQHVLHFHHPLHLGG